MYLGWVGNRYYLEKVLGSPTGLFDKCLFGVSIASVVLFLLIGPFYIFSSYSPWVRENPVLSANIKLNLQINKTVYADIQNGRIYEHIPKGKAGRERHRRHEFEEFNSSIPYNIYAIMSPYMKTFDDKQWQACKYSHKTETREFSPKQAQFCILRQHSDRRMALSKAGLDDLKDEDRKSVV